MPVTATWQIPFPNNTDLFCDGNEYTENIAERLDAIMAQFDADYARISIPALASISSQTAQPLTNFFGGQLTPSYTTVDVDTGSFTNLTSNNSGIIISQQQVGGHYIGSFYSQSVAPAGTIEGSASIATFPISYPLPDVFNLFWNSRMIISAGTNIQSTGSLIDTQTTTSGPISMYGSFATFSSGAWVFGEARLFFFWISDV
jgi:hypothetical protein